MAKLSKVDAAKAAGVSRQTLYTYIKDGRLSVDADGLIDTAELLRAGFALHTGHAIGRQDGLNIAKLSYAATCRVPAGAKLHTYFWPLSSNGTENRAVWAWSHAAPPFFGQCFLTGCTHQTVTDVFTGSTKLLFAAITLFLL
jgi:hypothetical protein